jgi:tryptophan synthase alpha subunit
MSRIDAAFRDLRAQGRTGLVTYVTAGDPDFARSREILVRPSTSRWPPVWPRPTPGPT